MKVIYFFLLAVCLVNGQDTTTTTESTSETTLTTEPTAPPTTSSSTTTTTPDITTTTTADVTTTTPDITTQSSTSSTTASSTTQSSTTASTTSTTGGPTSSPPPKPVPDDCSWNVTENNKTCIMATMRVLFTIPVEKKVEYIVISHNATTKGSNCSLSNETQSLVLSESNYTFTIIFENEKDKKKYHASNITLQYSLPDAEGFVYNDTNKLFSVNNAHSYKCVSESKIKLEDVTVEILDIQIQAFGVEEDKYGAIEECEADEKVSDAIPIAVGCALAALICVVLIAYLVGRRRNRQRGYQSV